MKIINYNEETGWADIVHNDQAYTIRISDFPSLEAVKKHLNAEEKKLNKKPRLKFELPKAE